MYAYSLPIERCRKELESCIKKHKNLIIRGATGCGKSTFVPLLVKEHRVAIIESRRIAVTALYNVLRKEVENVGYKMRFSRVISSTTTMTIFTDGTFLNEIDTANDYDYIIVDEVHERSIRTDIILGILKESYGGKLILMSATLQTKKLEQFFPAATFEVPSTTHPVTIHYLEKPTPDYILEAYLTLKKIVMESRNKDTDIRKDILVFLPGEEDIEDLFVLTKRLPGIAVFRVFARLDDSEQQKIFEPGDCQRVILSTNVCESSLTIPNIKYVVDTGLCKVKIFDGMCRLGMVPVSRESAAQRLGRCNRLGPGICYRLYTEFYLLPGQIPEIKRTDLSSVFLTLIGSKRKLTDFPFVDYPPLNNCIFALTFLVEKGCIEVVCDGKKIGDCTQPPTAIECENSFVDYSELMEKTVFRITRYGRRLLGHPLDIHLAHFYEQSVQAGLGYYGAILVSLISQENYNFVRKAEGEKISDIALLIQLMEGYLSTANRHEYALKHAVSVKGMEVARRVFRSLKKPKGGTVDQLERVFSASFSHNLCESNKDGSYRHIKSGKDVFVHPSSGFFKRREKKIVMVDLFESSKTYARIVGKFYGNSA